MVDCSINLILQLMTRERARPTSVLGFIQSNAKEIVLLVIILISISLPLTFSIGICCISVFVILCVYLWSSMA